MAAAKDGCVKPAAGPILPAAESNQTASGPAPAEGVKMTVRVGKPAPDFEASAFIDGGFKNVKLSDYSGQWRLVCFYPGDFTFV